MQLDMALILKGFKANRKNNAQSSNKAALHSHTGCKTLAPVVNDKFHSILIPIGSQNHNCSVVDCMSQRVINCPLVQTLLKYEYKE